MKLLIAIPALDEEESIGSIIERCLAARSAILAGSSVDEVEITVVSDGSTDRTVEIASAYRGRVGVIVFPENRGYGAAIKEAWNRSDADLLGFLDADGTCDPEFFATLCRSLLAGGADMALGSRMHQGSRMPRLRRVGNLLFARMLAAFSSAPVRDVASGMRVVRRDALPKLLPLPDGLHFTPAMSARALLSGELRVVEEEMPYAERTGRSKLRVLRDGLRFARIIFETALLYRPSRPLGLLALVLLAGAVGVMLVPAAYYLEHGAVLEWMIYRFIVAHLMGVASCQLFCAAYLAGRVVEIALGEAPVGVSMAHRLMGPFFRWRFFWSVPPALCAIGGLLVLSSFVDLVQTGATYEHWSRFIGMSFLWLVAFVLAGSRIVDHVLGLIGGRLRYLRARPAGMIAATPVVAPSTAAPG